MPKQPPNVDGNVPVSPYVRKDRATTGSDRELQLARFNDFIAQVEKVCLELNAEQQELGDVPEEFLGTIGRCGYRIL